MQPDLILQAMRRAAEQLQAKNFEAAYGHLQPLQPFLNEDPAFLKMFADASLHAARLPDAEAALAALARLEPSNGELIAAHGDVLRRMGHYEAALPALQQSLALQPNRVEFIYNAGLCLLEMGRLEGAERLFRRALDLKEDYSKAALGLANALEGLGDLSGAERVLDSMLVDQAGNPVVWFRLARLYDQLDQVENFERAVSTVARLEPKDPKIYAALARMLLARTRAQEALSWGRKGLSYRPNDPDLLRFLANLCFELGDQAFLAEYQRLPITALDAVALGDYLRFLSLAGRAEEALGCLQAAYGSVAPTWPVERIKMQLDLYRALDRFKEMLTLIEQVGGDALQEWAALAHLGLGDYAAADLLIDQVLAQQPHNQYWLALKSITVRHLDPAAYDRNFNAAQQVAIFDFADVLSDLERFKLNTLLEGWLLDQHVFAKAPLGQSVVGGTQSPGNLFLHQYPPLQKLKSVSFKLINDFLMGDGAAKLGPWVKARISGGLAVESAWSINVREQGFHVPHVHSKGWLSCVYYVAVPDCITDQIGNENAGVLALGRPGVSLPKSSVPDRLVVPKVGQLVVFPSYLWHETYPFKGHGQRVVVAFDLIPDSAASNP